MGGKSPNAGKSGGNGGRCTGIAFGGVFSAGWGWDAGCGAEGGVAVIQARFVSPPQEVKMA